MKTKIKYLLGASIIFLLTGCAASSPKDDEPHNASSRGESSYGDYYEPKPAVPDGGSDESMSSSDISSGSKQNNGNGQTNLPSAGQLKIYPRFQMLHRLHLNQSLHHHHAEYR